ncbi:hypothetical protein JB92DRAFT_2826056 [Gautieria morchelliformis]|nr:hypothetical protein JB92DRAFT_2826056 [Gautieria morchelliformis]
MIVGVFIGSASEGQMHLAGGLVLIGTGILRMWDACNLISWSLLSRARSADDGRGIDELGTAHDASRGKIGLGKRAMDKPETRKPENICISLRRLPPSTTGIAESYPSLFPWKNIDIRRRHATHTEFKYPTIRTYHRVWGDSWIQTNTMLSLFTTGPTRVAPIHAIDITKRRNGYAHDRTWVTEGQLSLEAVHTRYWARTRGKDRPVDDWFHWGLHAMQCHGGVEAWIILRVHIPGFGEAIVIAGSSLNVPKGGEAGVPCHDMDVKYRMNIQAGCGLSFLLPLVIYMPNLMKFQ